MADSRVYVSEYSVKTQRQTIAYFIYTIMEKLFSESREDVDVSVSPEEVWFSA